MSKQLSRAVQERRAPAAVEADDAQRKRWRATEFFASPPWACRAGAHLVKAIDPLARTVWEPACGDGTMSTCLMETFDEVWSSDIDPQGFGAQLDFLTAKPPMPVDFVISNPPFGLAADFVRHGLEVADRGVAVLCRLAFLESADRFDLHFGDPGLWALAPFSERVPMQLGPWNPDCSTATAYAWFLFRNRRSRAPIIIHIPPMEFPR